MKNRYGLGEAAGAPPFSLNIKNAETCRLIHELAETTGESMTAAVTQAVRERLDRIRAQRGGNLADRLVAIGRDCAMRLGEEYRSEDHDALLYDEKGLPR
jgi:antitoxin VapB